MAYLPKIETVHDHIAWSYANLARADAALQEGHTEYRKTHHIIRHKLFYGLKKGTMSMRSLYDDERIKMTAPQACYYCGSTQRLSVDHLIPRIAGGTDEGDNLIWACRSCNSSKGGKDMLTWMQSKGVFPPILLLRRYLKLVARYCDENDLLSLDIESARQLELPFDLTLLPYRFPPLDQLTLWVYPENEH